jgi:hypothetical protein
MPVTNQPRSAPVAEMLSDLRGSGQNARFKFLPGADFEKFTAGRVFERKSFAPTARVRRLSPPPPEVYMPYNQKKLGALFEILFLSGLAVLLIYVFYGI